MQVPDLLDHALSRSPDRPCVIQGPVRRTFAEVEDRTARVVTALGHAGVEAGDRVALLAANEPEFLELQIACQRAGAAFVPLNFRLSAPELRAIADDCTPRLLVHGGGFATGAEAVGAPVTWHLGDDGLGDPYDSQLLSTPAARRPLDASDLAQLLYTSGTTGLPKGARVTNGALFARVADFKGSVPISEHDVLLQTLPLFHLASMVLFAFVASAATSVTVRDFDPEQVLRAMDAEKVTHIGSVPTILEALLRCLPTFTGDISSLQTVVYGGSPITADLLTRSIAAFGCGFIQLYGMTEAGIAVLLEPADHQHPDKPHLIRAAGRDTAFCHTDIVRLDGSLADVGETGEITVTGPGLFDGYWNNPEATAEAIVDGRLHTGDAGVRDEDGYVYVTDRIKDMIITGGENVFCPEVENVLAAQPAVAEVAVIGLPDDRWGQRVHALIVSPEAIDADELDAWCRERLAGYKCPRDYERVDALPRNALGKVLKHVLRSERTEA